MIFGNQHIPLVNQMLQNHDPLDISFVINTGDTSRTHDNVNQWNLHFYAIHDLVSQSLILWHQGTMNGILRSLWNSTENQPALDIQEFPSTEIPNVISSLNETSYAFGYANAYFIMIG